MAVIDTGVADRVKRGLSDAARSREGRLAAGTAVAAVAAVAAKRIAAEAGGADEASGPSRKYRLRRSRPEAFEVRRVAAGRLDDAVELLRDGDADPVEAVHEARKDMKKLRSTLRLVRPVLGDRAYRRENERFRDAARSLSEVRDAQVLEETVAALAKRFDDEPPPGGWDAIAKAVVPSNGAGDLTQLRDRAAERIESGRAEIETLALPGKGGEVFEPGLRRAYARGRKRFREARAEPSDERLHEWRKRSKDLWYHLRLLRPGWRPVLEPLADQAHELSDLLGDDHDLVVLRERLDRVEALSAEQRGHLEKLIERRREELQASAFAYGERLYAEKSKAFAKRIVAYWEAAPLK